MRKVTRYEIVHKSTCGRIDDVESVVAVIKGVSDGEWAVGWGGSDDSHRDTGGSALGARDVDGGGLGRPGVAELWHLHYHFENVHCNVLDGVGFWVERVLGN